MKYLAILLILLSSCGLPEYYVIDTPVVEKLGDINPVFQIDFTDSNDSLQNFTLYYRYYYKDSNSFTYDDFVDATNKTEYLTDLGYSIISFKSESVDRVKGNDTVTLSQEGNLIKLTNSSEYENLTDNNNNGYLIGDTDWKNSYLNSVLEDIKERENLPDYVSEIKIEFSVIGKGTILLPNKGDIQSDPVYIGSFSIYTN